MQPSSRSAKSRWQLEEEAAAEEISCFARSMDPEMIERLQRAGISLPARYIRTEEAHPAGHPVDDGTADEQHPPVVDNHEAKGD